MPRIRRRNPQFPGRYVIRFPKGGLSDLHIRDATQGAIDDEFDVSAAEVLDYLQKHAPKRGLVITDHTEGEMFRRRHELRNYTFNTDLNRKNNPRRKAKKASEVESLYVYEGDTGYYVKIIFRTSAQARDAATDLYLHADWEQYRTEVQTSEPRSAAAAKALAKAVAKDLRFPVADIGTHASRKGAAARSAGLKKGQNLMKKAAAAYRAGKYPTMQAALRGVARGGR